MSTPAAGSTGTPDEQVQAGIEAQAQTEAVLDTQTPDVTPVEPVPTTKDLAETALADFYRWHDSDTRWTRKLDAIKAYIAELEAAPAPAAPDAPVANDTLTPGVGVAASQPGKKSKK